MVRVALIHSLRKLPNPVRTCLDNPVSLLEIASLSCLATIITFLSLLFLPILMNSEHYHQSTRTLERFATFQCWENCLPWRVLQKLCTDTVQGCTFGSQANLLCLLGVLIRPGKFMLQRATRKLKVLEEFVQVPIQSYTHLTHCSRKRHKQLQPAFTKWLHLTGVAKCDPEAGKCVKETPLKPLQPLAFHWFHSEWCPDHVNIMCVYWNPSDSSSPENLWPQHHLGHLKKPQSARPPQQGEAPRRP